MTAKEWRNHLKSMVNECAHGTATQAEVGRTIVMFANQLCKEQREACADPLNSKVSILDSITDKTYISEDDIKNAPIPEI
jgi:hypothetical protein